MRITLALLLALAVASPASAAWPVKPLNVQHPIRGGFLDPRPGAGGLMLHTGVDVSVRDDQPERAHPPYRTHRVYAIAGGVAEYPRETVFQSCTSRKVQIGRFTYSHVDPVGVVSAGYHVDVGDFVGWSCKGQWHVHLSERGVRGGRVVLVNPLRPGGSLSPYADATPPVVHELAFALPAPLHESVVNGAYASDDGGARVAANALRGVVDPRVWAGDPEGLPGWPSRFLLLAGERAPERVRVTLRRLRDQRLLWSHEAWNAAYLDASGRAAAGTFAPGTRQNLPARQCLTTWFEDGCAGRLWFSLAPPGTSAWDTRAYENGRYDLCVVVEDPFANSARRCVTATVAN